MAATITYLGGPDTGNVDKCDWGGVVFEKDKAFTVDMRGKNAERKALLTHILHKARNNRFFRVDGVDDAEKPVATVPVQGTTQVGAQVAAQAPPRPFGPAPTTAQNAVPDKHDPPPFEPKRV